jgi:putative sigma-54 modulation protein
MALDLVLDKVTAQLGRHKDRKTSLRRHRINPVNVLSLSRTGTLSPLQDEQVDEDQQPSLPITEERNEEIWLRVMEIRRIHTKPMSDQEVIAEMEAHGLSFYPFFNVETQSVNVIYRLDTGGYGLLVPALEEVPE